MRHFGTALLSILVASGCAQFSEQQELHISEAIDAQAAALSDPLFEEILLELEANGDVVWEARLNRKALAEVGDYPTRMTWLIERYKEEGGLARDNLRAWRKWNPRSSTTAVYTGKLVKLNLWRFNENKYALLNTFIHEKNHSFGLIHDRSQTRSNNHCDAGYLSGDVAEAIARDAGGESNRSTSHSPYCPALCELLNKRGLWSPCIPAD